MSRDVFLEEQLRDLFAEGSSGALVAADLLEEVGYHEEANLLSLCASKGQAFLPRAHDVCLASVERGVPICDVSDDAMWRPLDSQAFLLITLPFEANAWLKTWLLSRGEKRLENALFAALVGLGSDEERWGILRGFIYALDSRFYPCGSKLERKARAFLLRKEDLEGPRRPLLPLFMFSSYEWDVAASIRSGSGNWITLEDP